MSKELKKGCVVFMKAESGLCGYGNAQCINEVHHESLGTIGLYGHNQHYKTYDIAKVVSYPVETTKLETAAPELLAACEKFIICESQKMCRDCPIGDGCKVDGDPIRDSIVAAIAKATN